MGTVVQTFEPLAGYNTGSVIAELYVPTSGPTLTPGWAFTAPGTNLEICFPAQAVNYGGGNAVVQIDWYCTAATSGTATWIAKVIAVTPGDAESVEASDNATSTTSSATTVTATAGGLTRTTITVSALDSMASGDKIWIKIQRATSDTSIAQTIYLTEMMFSYGDGLTGTPGSGDFVGPAGATATAIVKYADATGKLGANSGVLIDASNNVTGLGTINTRTIATLATGPGASTAGRVATYSSTDGITLLNGPRLEADLVAGPASSTTGNLPSFNGAGGKTLQDSGILAANVVVGPATATSGRVAVYNGTTGKLVQDGTKLESDLVTGPASSTDTAIMRFNGATGKIAQNSGITVDASNNVAGMGTLNTRTIANLVAGPGAAVTSGNIMSWNGTGGATAQDSGVSATAHAARHNPAGADAMFTGTWTANDYPMWNGSIWVPKFTGTAILTTTAAGASGGAANTFVDVPGLSIALPRAGTYLIETQALSNQTGTAGVFYYSFGFTGTLTRISASGEMAIPSTGGAWFYLGQNAITTTGGTTMINTSIAGGGTPSITSPTQGMAMWMLGTITVSTTGNLTLRCARVSATTTAPTITIVAGASIKAQET